jgi:dipeptidyl-peptidase 4
VRFTDRDDAWVEAMDELRWIEGGGRFLWLSERDGWRHLYAVSATDQTTRLMTPDEFDVISIAGVNEQQGCVYFLASPDNPTQSYRYRAPLNGPGTVERVSPPDQQGTHSYELSKEGRWAPFTLAPVLASPPSSNWCNYRIIKSFAPSLATPRCAKNWPH